MINIYDEELIIKLDGKEKKVLLPRLSEKFATANKLERETYTFDIETNNVTWTLLNETWTIDDLLKFKKLRFIAYFDYLGTSLVIRNNRIDDVYYRIWHSSRDIEYAFAYNNRGKTVGVNPLADLKNIKCHCLRFSDTVLFYSDDFTEEELNQFGPKIQEQLTDLIIVCDFYLKMTNNLYPTRGCLTIGEVEYDIWYPTQEERKEMGFLYIRNSIFGKGLVDAHDKGEAQNWMGAFATNNIIEILTNNGLNNIVDQYFVLYNLPYNTKKEIDDATTKIIEKKSKEYCFRIVNKANDSKSAKTMMQKYSERIRDAFEYQQILPLKPKELKKLDNTIKFLKYCIKN